MAYVTSREVSATQTLSLGTGTGRLTQFRLVVNVRLDGTYRFWDGTHRSGRGH